MRQSAIPFGENRQRRVITHGADSLARRLDHRLENVLEFFKRVADRQLTPTQLFRLV